MYKRGHSAEVPMRPGSGRKWSEVCEQVQLPDGAVRASPPFKSDPAMWSASLVEVVDDQAECFEPMRPATPPKKLKLIMPDPVRIMQKTLIMPESDGKLQMPVSLRVGRVAPLKRDPYRRDAQRRLTRAKFSLESFVEYFKGVSAKVDENIKNDRMPTTAKLDAFTSRLLESTRKQLRHAPKTLKHSLQVIVSRHFQKFWDFAKNEKVAAITPEELKATLVSLIEALASEFKLLKPDTDQMVISVEKLEETTCGSTNVLDNAPGALVVPADDAIDHDDCCLENTPASEATDL